MLSEFQEFIWGTVRHDCSSQITGWVFPSLRLEAGGGGGGGHLRTRMKGEEEEQLVNVTRSRLKR